MNPSGFEAHTRYNVGGERPNNDFLRYEIAHGVWRAASCTRARRRSLGGRSTAARARRSRSRASSRGGGRPLPTAALDLHQDNFIHGEVFYSYVFGDRAPYRALQARSGALLPVLRSCLVDSGYELRQRRVRADAEGFIGAPPTAASPTTSTARASPSPRRSRRRPTRPPRSPTRSTSSGCAASSSSRATAAPDRASVVLALAARCERAVVVRLLSNEESCAHRSRAGWAGRLGGVLGVGEQVQRGSGPAVRVRRETVPGHPGLPEERGVLGVQLIVGRGRRRRGRGQRRVQRGGGRSERRRHRRCGRRVRRGGRRERRLIQRGCGGRRGRCECGRRRRECRRRAVPRRV